MEADAALARFNYGRNALPYAVTLRNGVYQRLRHMRADEDPRDYARAIDRESARLEADAARSVIAPDFVIDATLPAVEAARAQAVSLPEGDRLAEALTRQIATLHRLRARARSEAGVCRLPDGEAYYALTLHFRLGAAIAPREAHARALEHARALQAEAETLLRAHGLTSGGVAERLRALAADETQLYDATAEGKAEAVADMAAQLGRSRALVADAFAGLDLAPATVRRLPTRFEARGAQSRRVGPNYYVDLGEIHKRPRWTLGSVVHHEALPGHIMLAPFLRDAAPPALQERYAGGYEEGWAIYAEQLANELGAFEGAPLARLGYLQWRLFRMARIVADTGLHVLRWSRERAVAEMRALQGDSIAFISIEDDVTRMCAQPGIAAAQGLAALHIADLRARSRHLSLAQFHTAMLRRGPLAPPGLDQAVRV